MPIAAFACPACIPACSGERLVRLAIMVIRLTLAMGAALTREGANPPREAFAVILSLSLRMPGHAPGIHESVGRPNRQTEFLAGDQFAATVHEIALENRSHAFSWTLMDVAMAIGA